VAKKPGKKAKAGKRPIKQGKKQLRKVNKSLRRSLRRARRTPASNGTARKVDKRVLAAVDDLESTVARVKKDLLDVLGRH
jgi:hypothetical protein